TNENHKILHQNSLLCYVWATQEKSVLKAREKTNVTLQTGETLLNAESVWTFGAETPNMRIATIMRGKEVKNDYGEIFKDRLLIDHHTGSLTIIQVKTSDTGKYQFQSIGTKILMRVFHLIVYSDFLHSSIPLPAPPLSSSSVTVECSVHNSRELMLSWYRGKESLKKTSSPKLTTLTLSLEVDPSYGDNYSCVAENPVERKTTRLSEEDILLGYAGMIKQTSACLHFA
uniref:Ig-like domain-containing protein n=1 Tax=Cyprinodon variegatus TaxID=28743 RepID=A0A3Q2D9Y3_CYPVA